MSDCGIRKRRAWPEVAIALVAFGLAAAGSQAEASHNPSRQTSSPAKVETTVTAQNTTQAEAVSEVDDGKNCGQSRKRLFVEGEGWIVRRVTTCY